MARVSIILMAMRSFLLKRLIWLGTALLFISLVTFALMHAIPGGPWEDPVEYPEPIRHNLDAKYGFDKPLWQQYLRFATNALQGDLGLSITYGPVTDRILAGFKTSAVLGMLSLIVA